MSLARSYAQALLESTKPAELEAVRKSLLGLVQLLDASEDLRVSLCAPVTSKKDKFGVIQVLETKLGLPQVLARFLHVVARKGRFAYLSEMYDALETVRLERDGGLLGELTSADEMSPADVLDLAASFSKKIGKKIEFRLKRDPSLLAGLKVTVGGVTYDGSLRAQLSRLEQELSQGSVTQ